MQQIETIFSLKWFPNEIKSLQKDTEWKEYDENEEEYNKKEGIGEENPKWSDCIF